MRLQRLAYWLGA